MIMKFDEVFRMDTWVVEVPRARALVNRAHIMPLKIRFRPKKICLFAREPMGQVVSEEG